MTTNTTLNWTASPITSINGEPAADFILSLGLQSQPYLDPDAIYNQMFDGRATEASSIVASSSGNDFANGAYPLGIESNNTTFLFANGSRTSVENIAVLLQNFTGIDSAQALFEKFEIPPTNTPASSSSATTSTPVPSITALRGYPKPVVIQSDGYTSGYFLDNSDVAILVLNGFLGKSEEDYTASGRQQNAVKNFLSACKSANKKKLIVDL